MKNVDDLPASLMVVLSSTALECFQEVLSVFTRNGSARNVDGYSAGELASVLNHAPLCCHDKVAGITWWVFPSVSMGFAFEIYKILYGLLALMPESDYALSLSSEAVIRERMRGGGGEEDEDEDDLLYEEFGEDNAEAHGRDRKPGDVVLYQYGNADLYEIMVSLMEEKGKDVNKSRYTLPVSEEDKDRLIDMYMRWAPNA